MFQKKRMFVYKIGCNKAREHQSFISKDQNLKKEKEGQKFYKLGEEF